MWQSSTSGFPYLTAFPLAPLPNKVSCFVSMCVSSDNSFLSVRQEPSFGPWKGSAFLQQYGWGTPLRKGGVVELYPELVHWELALMGQAHPS